MKMEKFKRFLDMTDHPERYTEKQLEELLSDEEMASWYQELADVDSALRQPSAMTDEMVEHELQRAAQQPRRPSWHKAAAAIAGFTVVSGLVLAAILLFSPASINQRPTSGIRHSDTPSPVVQTDSLVVFDNVELDSILYRAATYYNMDVTFSNDETRRLRFFVEWNRKLPLDSLVELLNHFEEVDIHVENRQITVR